MKAIIEFDLDDYSDRKAHKRAISATDAFLVLHELDNYFRNKLKYTELSEEVSESLDAARTELRELCERNGVNMDDLE